MKGQNMNGMQMRNMSGMMGIQNAMQRIGKGKRKYTVKISKHNKKFLGKFVEEIQKQMGSENNPQMKGVLDFLTYLKAECAKKTVTEIKMSFDELEFLKKMVVDSVKGMEGMTYKWYQIINKLMVKTMIKSNRSLLEELK
ncbi:MULTISPECIES: hypothetical protein [Psychrilyobacter]|uniref:Uncharacterized protein n=1 Tax=Psychrilyobacter piezotolerans TaxID=2293438 RepID=A0ABX9KD88_9FUSO|nr:MULTISPECIES: hypothetical protein [Psychrilyobacter]MCS5422795.1 hypothetical protein [Psychrilyobacter sp. S5]NDI79237.1 hypothetical protein [Psychrilyobacter piezotolerans]RDE58852.1 hypothetical protein DV867_15130 [Psychrilyobacter sp. S5]REI39354.1 hypothetical protein DYH56_15130 [Psychrilyobacter piezotolerans]